jgi:biotin transporter BioY
MANATYADLLRPANPGQRWIYHLLLILGFSLLIGLSAQVEIPLQPVPITGQTFAVLMAGAVLGSRRGALSILAYLAQGLAGLPVFAGGKAGMAALMGPSGGYLIGFVAAAFVTGLLAERGWDRRLKTNFLAMLLGNIVIYVFGLPWLAMFIGAQKAWMVGLVPFIPGDLLKLVLATGLLPLAWRIAPHRPSEPLDD